MRDKYLVAIPVFNEEGYVSRVLDATHRYADHILVVDDGSTDRTAELVSRYPEVAVIRHEVNGGYGSSLIDAFAYAAEKGFEWVITMDCDEQHEPAAIPRFVEAMAEDDADIVSGSRYMRLMANNGLPPSDRRSINEKITKLLNERLGFHLTDAFCGFKAHRVESMTRMKLTETGYAFPMQFWAQAAYLGLRVRELPVRLVYNDPNRHFGGGLDNPTVRYRHYLEVFETEMKALAARCAAEKPADFCADVPFSRLSACRTRRRCSL